MNALRARANNRTAIRFTPACGANQNQMKAAIEILDSANALHSEAKSSDLDMIAYLLRLVILEAEDFLCEIHSAK